MAAPRHQDAELYPAPSSGRAKPYRFYVLVGAGGVEPPMRCPPVDVHCPTDVAAMKHAGTLATFDTTVEVWERGRLIGEIGKCSVPECSDTLRD